MELEYRCPSCTSVLTAENWSDREILICSACGGSLPVPAGARAAGDGTLRRCPVCAGEEFYVQRDFNRRVGLALVVLGALLAWPTRGLSLLVMVVLDLILYAAVPEITICYRCEAIFRGLKRNPAHEGFSLATEEKYRVIRAHDAETRAARASPSVPGAAAPPSSRQVLP
jgi:hypothetical protein